MSISAVDAVIFVKCFATLDYAYVGGNPLSYTDPLGLRPLTQDEKDCLQGYIPQTDLDNADVHVGKMPWYAPEWATGITRGNDIYFRDGSIAFDTRESIALLGHELVHVGQYRDGMTAIGYGIASRNGCEKNPYEVNAYDLQTKIQKELKNKSNGGACTCKN